MAGEHDRGCDRSEEIRLSLEIHFGLLQGFQVTTDIRPFEGLSLPFKTFEKLGLQDKCQETTEHVTTDRLVTFVVDRTRLKDTLCCPEQLLDHPQLFVFQRHFFRREPGISSEDPFPVVAGFQRLLFLLLFTPPSETVYTKSPPAVTAVW